MSKLWSDKEFELCNKFVWKYARKYLEAKNMHLPEDRLNDYVQQAWLKLSEYKKKNPENEIWAGLVKNIVYGEFADLIHDDIKHKAISIDRTSGDDSSGLSGEEDVYQLQSDAVASQRMHNIFDTVQGQELINLVDQLSNPLQRKYLMWFLEKAQIKDYGILSDTFEYDETSSQYKEGYTDSALAKYLGFTGTDDYGYKKLKQQMISLLEPYIGKYEKEKRTRTNKSKA